MAVIAMIIAYSAGIDVPAIAVFYADIYDLLMIRAAGRNGARP